MINQSAHQGEQGRALNGAAVSGIQEVEHDVHVDLAREELARMRMKKDHTLDQIEGGQDEDVVLVV